MAVKHFIGGMGTGILVGAILLATFVIFYLYSKYKKLKNVLAEFFQDDCMTNLKQGISWPWNAQYLTPLPQPTFYSQESALYLTKCAALASALHCDPSKWQTPPGFDSGSLLNLQIPGESIGYMLHDSTRNISLLVWRGTESQQDLVIDAEFKQVKSNLDGMQGMVHEGFSSVMDQLGAQIAKYLNDKKPTTVYIAGHSLGAGLATLSAPWVAAMNSQASVQAYAFAPPSVGDADFKQWASELRNLGVFRFQNTADLVPTLPPGLPGSEYFELGSSYIYTNDTGTAGGDHGLITYRGAIQNGKWLI